MSHQGRDTGTKREKVDLESECKVPGESNLFERSTTGLVQHIASTSLETVASTSDVTSANRTENSGLNQLPDEMHEMRIRDEKTADHDDKVILWSHALANISVRAC